MAILHNDWAAYLNDEFEKPYYQKLRKMLIQEYRRHTIYPDKYEIYAALHLTPYAQTRVVILGQDPYHGLGQAHGLSFSVKPDVEIPPSLQNIYKELHADLGCSIPEHGCLEKWSKQGVLLLNSVLTVRAGNPASHRGLGWENFTDQVIVHLSQRETPVVFICGASMPRKRKNGLTTGAILSSNRRIRARCPHTAGFSAAARFQRLTLFCAGTGLPKSTGKLSPCGDPRKSGGLHELLS